MRYFVIDDHPGVVHMHAQILASLEGCTPEMYTKPVEALAALQACTEDSFILLDLNMPELDGDEMLTRLDRMDPVNACHVVIISGVLEDVPDFVSELDHIKVEAVIPKPVRPDQLLDVIKRLPRQ